MIIEKLRNWLLGGGNSGVEVLAPQLDSFFAGRLIEGAILDRRPFFAGRLGWMECYALGLWDTGQPVGQSFIEKLRRHAGVFPATEENFRSFCSLYCEAARHVDLLGLMQSPYEKQLVERHFTGVSTCSLGGLEPYLNGLPWSKGLEGLRVLVVHAFADSIAHQYRTNRARLFADPRVLPEFDLQCVKAPQTMLAETAGFSCWAEALGDLKKRVDAVDYDVAIIGCGAYGLPLGAHIKQSGKVAVHFGGAVQLLFGISGSRWRNMPEFRALMRDAWRSPAESERPLGWEKIEEGCYW
jgi:hypothetical protein